MSQLSFNKLSTYNKVLLIKDMGVQLSSIEFYDHRIFLFAFNGLLIEVYRNIETKKIESITVAGYSDLDKFISRITLPPSKRDESTNSKDLIY
jgi:hypothetical protein